MSEEQKPVKIVFAPGCLEQLEHDMSPEDLQELMNDIGTALADGSLFSKSAEVNLDELQESDPELYAKLMDRMEDVETEGIKPPTLN